MHGPEACTRARTDMEKYPRGPAPNDVCIGAARWQRPARDHRNVPGQVCQRNPPPIYRAGEALLGARVGGVAQGCDVGAHVGGGHRRQRQARLARRPGRQPAAGGVQPVGHDGVWLRASACLCWSAACTVSARHFDKQPGTGPSTSRVLHFALGWPAQLRRMCNCSQNSGWHTFHRHAGQTDFHTGPSETHKAVTAVTRRAAQVHCKTQAAE